MKFTYSVVIAALMQTHTPATLTSLPTCVQHVNATDYGNAWATDGTGCKDSAKLSDHETAGCCAKFNYVKIDTSLGYDEGVITEVV